MTSAAQTKAQRDTLLAIVLQWITFGDKAPLLKPQTRLMATSRLVVESRAIVRWCIAAAPNDPRPQSSLNIESLVMTDIRTPKRPPQKEPV